MQVIKSTFEEDLPKEKFPQAADYCRETALAKGLEVAERVMSRDSGIDHLPDLIISSDTIVEHQGKVLEKPADEEDAFCVLSSLSGSTHNVHTGVALILPKVKDSKDQSTEGLRVGGVTVKSFAVTTEVTFDKITPEAIRAYIATGEPMDKAGSYGIQGVAGSFVTGISGCYFNVMGLPINRLCSEIDSMIRAGVL